MLFGEVYGIKNIARSFTWKLVKKLCIPRTAFEFLLGIKTSYGKLYEA